MSIIKNWTIKSLSVKDSFNNFNNVVFNITYSFKAEIINDNPKASEYVGSVVLQPPVDTFIPYEQLTEEIVLQWVFTELGTNKVTEIENNAVNQAIAMSDPTGWSSPPLPWSV